MIFDMPKESPLAEALTHAVRRIVPAEQFEAAPYAAVVIGSTTYMLANRSNNGTTEVPTDLFRRYLNSDERVVALKKEIDEIDNTN